MLVEPGAPVPLAETIHGLLHHSHHHHSWPGFSRLADHALPTLGRSGPGAFNRRQRPRQAQLDATTPRRREESEDQAAGTTKLAGAADTTLPRLLIRTLSEDQTRTDKPRFHGL